MTRAPFIVIDGKPYRWKDILELRRAQLAAAAAAEGSQLALFAALHDDRRPPAERTASGRYLNQACSQIRPRTGAAYFLDGALSRGSGNRALARLLVVPAACAACAGRAPAASNRLPRRDRQKRSIMLRSSCVDHLLFSAFYAPWVSLATLRHGRQYRRFLLRRSDERYCVGDRGMGRVGEVTTLTSGQLCKNDGKYIICDFTTPTISGGAVGIGTATPQSLLHIYNGEVQVGSSGASCAVANAGAIRFSGSTIYYCNGTSWVIDGSGAAAGSTGYVQFNGGSAAFGADSNFFWDNTNKRLGIGTASSAAPLDIQSGTVTTSVPALNIAQTWNNAATTFDAPLFMNITNTANDSGSKIIDLQIGGTSKFSIDNTWLFTLSGGTNNVISGYVLIGTNTYIAGAGPYVSSNGQYAFTNASNNPAGASDTYITRQAAANLHLGQAAAAAPVAQTLGVQNVVAGTSNTAVADFTITGCKAPAPARAGRLC